MADLVTSSDVDALLSSADNAAMRTAMGVVNNATHTGDVTGATTLTINPSAITGKTLVTATVADNLLISDASDSGALKKVTVQTIIDLVSDVAAVDGTADEVQIQAAIDSLYTTVTNEAETGGIFNVIDNMNSTPSGTWVAQNSSVLTTETTIKFAGTSSLKITPSGSHADPGAELTFSSRDFSAYTYIDFWIYVSAGVNKLRVRIFDGSNNERRYNCHVENSGQWVHVLIPIANPYFISATPPTMAAIVKMHISQMAGEVSATVPAAQVFYIDQVAISTPATLANKLVRVGSDVVTNSGGGTTYTNGTDYEIDWDTGTLTTITSGSITSGQSLLVDYVHGGGTVRVPAGRYSISETGITLYPHLVLDLTGCYLSADGTYSDGGHVMIGSKLYRTEVVNGFIDGRRDRLGIDTNINGIEVVDCKYFTVRNTSIRNVNGPAINVTKSTFSWNENVVISEVFIEECACEFTDHFGEDYAAQGGDSSKAALIVHNTRYLELLGVINRNCHSDAMWIKESNHGVMAGCQIIASRMGAIFFETCVNWTITGNMVQSAGSRGCTIEWNSKEIVFSGNTIRLSGRECVWLAGTQGVLVVGNVLYGGGRVRMFDGLGDPVLSTVRVSSQSPYDSSDNVIANNLIYSDSTYQTQAIMIDTDGGTNTGTVIRGNHLIGTQTTITNSGTSSVISDGNPTTSPGTTGGSGSGGAGNQYIAVKVGATTYKVLHDGTV